MRARPWAAIAGQKSRAEQAAEATRASSRATRASEACEAAAEIGGALQEPTGVRKTYDSEWAPHGAAWRWRHYWVPAGAGGGFAASFDCYCVIVLHRVPTSTLPHSTHGQRAAGAAGGGWAASTPDCEESRCWRLVAARPWYRA